MHISAFPLIAFWVQNFELLSSESFSNSSITEESTLISSSTYIALFNKNNF